MKILNNISAFCLAVMFLLGSVCLASCDDEISTDQYTGGISLNVFGPSPVVRGGILRFLGSGMDQVTAVVIPGCEDITGDSITVISDREINVTVPQEAEEGYVTLRTPVGDITTKTLLTYTEDISVDSISPLTVRPGDELTITGEYLNLMHAVVFEGVDDDVEVPEDDFIEHTRYVIRLYVPDGAVSGKVGVSDAAEEGIPNILYADDMLTVVLPSVSEVAEYDEVSIGDVIAVTGSDLDLVSYLKMSNDETITDFTVNSDGTELTFIVPENASTGEVAMVAVSGVEIPMVTLQLVEPEVDDESYAARPGGVLTVTGVNLDMVDRVTFVTSSGTEVDGTDVTVSNYGTSLTVTVPETAVSGDVQLHAGGNTVTFSFQTLKAAIVSSDVSSLYAGEELTIYGTDFDLVASVSFGGTEVTDINVSNDGTSLTVTVPSSLSAGEVEVTLTMSNGETGDGSLTVTIEEVPGTTLWTGSIELGNWVNSLYLSDSSVNYLSNVEVGDRLRVVFTEDSSSTWWQVTLKVDWESVYINGANISNGNIVELESGATSYDIEITDDLISEINSASDCVTLGGCYITITELILFK